MENTPEPWRFYEVTKVLLMPSLFFENSPLAACEAMLNAFPLWRATAAGCRRRSATRAFCSTSPRGIRRSRVCFPRPRRSSRGWKRSFDFGMTRRITQSGAIGRESAASDCVRAFGPDIPEFFGSICRQPGPPLVPKEMAAVETTKLADYDDRLTPAIEVGSIAAKEAAAGANRPMTEVEIAASVESREGDLSGVEGTDSGQGPGLPSAPEPKSLLGATASSPPQWRGLPPPASRP